jgi:hypothetical protein
MTATSRTFFRRHKAIVIEAENSDIDHEPEPSQPASKQKAGVVCELISLAHISTKNSPLLTLDRTVGSLEMDFDLFYGDS